MIYSFEQITLVQFQHAIHCYTGVFRMPDTINQSLPCCCHAASHQSIDNIVDAANTTDGQVFAQELEATSNLAEPETLDDQQKVREFLSSILNYDEQAAQQQLEKAGQNFFEKSIEGTLSSEEADAFQKELTGHFIKDDFKISNDELQALNSVANIRSLNDNRAPDASFDSLQLLEEFHYFNKGLSRDGLNSPADVQFEQKLAELKTLDETSTESILELQFYSGLANRPDANAPLTDAQAELYNFFDNGTPENMSTEELMTLQYDISKAFMA